MLVDQDSLSRNYYYHPKFNLLTTVDCHNQKSLDYQLVLREQESLAKHPLAEKDLLFRPSYSMSRIYLSHRHAIASASLEELEELLETVKDETAISGILLQIRRGSLEGDEGLQAASRLWSLTSLYCECF